jgi:hypothetical protein
MTSVSGLISDVGELPRQLRQIWELTASIRPHSELVNVFLGIIDNGIICSIIITFGGFHGASGQNAAKNAAESS